MKTRLSACVLLTIIIASFVVPSAALAADSGYVYSGTVGAGTKCYTRAVCNWDTDITGHYAIITWRSYAKSDLDVYRIQAYADGYHKANASSSWTYVGSSSTKYNSTPYTRGPIESHFERTFLAQDRSVRDYQTRAHSSFLKTTSSAPLYDQVNVTLY